MSTRSVICACSIVMLCLTGAYVCAQQPHLAQPTSFVLRSFDEYPLAVPPFSFSSSQCDAQSNVFFDLTGDEHATKTFLRVSSDGSYALPLLLPSDVAGTHAEWHYSVDQEGGLYILFSEVQNHTLIHLSAFGKQLSRVSLQLPRYYHVTSFAVLPHKTSMFVGYSPTSDTVADPTYQALAIIVNEAGTPVRTQRFGNEVSSMDRRDGLVTAHGTESFVYIFRDTLTELSPEGAVIKEYALEKPAPYAFATKLQVLNGTAAIVYSHRVASSSDQSLTSAFGPLEQQWLTVDLTNGSTETLKMPANFVGSALCYVGNDRFINFTVLRDKPTLVVAGK